ncbi:1-phosphofructokinase family hexose kinase [Actinoplanes aureus]|uniref:1-phosphofructokinase family hexose kinase n=1 Tax=Actinoplanes aureus TaxID=2792083 RepID=A0A931G084_9ACTN|nr:1-phosphofructokinase family hexose kinase [Actinoplanes aureus]MBG0563791.1 1-phosphofructokinase family hexose kinase [Actinoplanes aureus]
MIITVTLNAALDITYGMTSVAMGDTNRVARVLERPGGKGLNVARVLHTLGEPVLACGLLGGGTGEAVRAQLTLAGIDAAFTPIEGESRRTVVLAEPDRTTLLNEPGPRVTADEWQSFLADFHRLTATAGVVVLSGSLPPGVPVNAYETLAVACRRAGAGVILDADGEPLRHGLAGRPDIVKPNAGELFRLGLPAEAVRRAGATAVVVSRGRDGLLAHTPHGSWTATPPAITGNPTGAGDALVAALACGLAHDWSWPDRLRHGAALSAAAVRAEVAGAFEPATYRALLPQIRLQPL